MIIRKGVVMTTIDNQNKIFFCLDIGTRSIMGIVAEFIDDKLNIIHSVTEFHKDRVMLDGQIHDIVGVTKIARLVEERLESEIRYELKEVSIAAAGRSLKTILKELKLKRIKILVAVLSPMGYILNKIRKE